MQQPWWKLNFSFPIHNHTWLIDLNENLYSYNEYFDSHLCLFFLKKTKPSSSSIHHHERMWPMFPSTILKHYHHIRWVLSLLLLCVCTFGFHSLLILDNGGGGHRSMDAWMMHDELHVSKISFIYFFILFDFSFFSVCMEFFLNLLFAFVGLWLFFLLLLLMMNVWEIIFIQTNFFFNFFLFKIRTHWMKL